MASKRLRHVAVIQETAVAPRRRLLAGIARYMHEHEPWAIYLKPHGVEKSLGAWLRDWNGDGIISAAWGEEAAEVRAIGVPTVDLTGYLRHLGVPLVHADDRGVGRLGAEHLRDRNFTNFGFIEYAAAWWSRERRAGFEEALASTNHRCSVYEMVFPAFNPSGPREWEKQQAAMAEWIHSLPKPVGVMASTDALGQQFLESCLRVGATVPEQVAVVGADNDELICDVCYPPLSSVIIDDMRRGYQTAATLDGLMRGEPPPTGTVLIEPPGVVCRASTDILAIDDAAIARALRFIRERSCDGIGVADLMRAVPVSRGVLERKFRKLLGHTINDEIVRVRLNRAVELLTVTELELKVIAAKAGFSNASYMGAVFRDKLGRTPGSYRSLSTIGRKGPDGPGDLLRIHP